MKRTNNLADLGKLLADTPPIPTRKEVESASPREIRLQRTIKVSCWRVIGQVAKAQKREELRPVLLRARERGSTGAGDIAGHLLFEAKSRRIVAQRLLQIAESYGLLEGKDGKFELTDSGHTAIATEQVYVPEQGTWTIWASDDPMLATPILRVEPWTEPTAYDEVFGKERNNARDRPFEKLPQWVRDAIGVVAVPFVGGAPLRIDQLDAECEVAEPKANLRVMWDVSGARLRAEGALDGASVNTVIDAPEISTEMVWKQLLDSEGLWPQWDAAARVLRVEFGETTPGERESLVRAVTFKRPHIDGRDRFDATTVEGIALRARSQQDANDWAAWRLRERISDYAADERFSAWTTEAVAPFKEFHPTPPTRRALAVTVRHEWRNRPSATAWHLVAAEDWSL